MTVHKLLLIMQVLQSVLVILPGIGLNLNLVALSQLLTTLKMYRHPYIPAIPKKTNDQIWILVERIHQINRMCVQNHLQQKAVCKMRAFSHT